MQKNQEIDRRRKKKQPSHPDVAGKCALSANSLHLTVAKQQVHNLTFLWILYEHQVRSLTHTFTHERSKQFFSN